MMGYKKKKCKLIENKRIHEEVRNDKKNLGKNKEVFYTNKNKPSIKKTFRDR